jgi:hypothetical protein
MGTLMWCLNTLVFNVLLALVFQNVLMCTRSRAKPYDCCKLSTFYPDVVLLSSVIS